MTLNFIEKMFCIGGDGTEVPTVQMFKRGFIISGSATPTWQDVILSGNTALTLVNAKADSLEYLKLFGGTELLPSTYLDTVTLSGGCEQSLLPDAYQLYTSVEADGITYEYSSQNLTQIPCKRIADNVFGLYNYTTKVFISEV